MRCRALTFGILASTLLATSAAYGQGQANDLALNRLSFFNRDPGGPASSYTFAGGCGTASADWAQCEPDNQLFVNLISQLGVALAPPLLAPADTHGYNGLYFGYEGTITGINATADYWHRGTEGTADGLLPGGQGTSAVRDRVPNALYVSHFHVRKAFPLGFELGLHTSWLHDSSMVLLGLDIRWALFEGFRNGVTGWIPDLAVRGAVNTLVGNPQLYLTMVSVDAVLSKRLTVAGQAVITPYIGGQALLILGDSTVIDGTPTRSSYQECPTRTPVFSTDADGHRRSDLVCTDAPTLPPMGANDSRNEMVFMQTRVVRTRGFAGLRLRYSYFTVTGEFSYDLLDPQWLNGDPNANGNVGRPDNSNAGAHTVLSLDNARQWQTSFGVGLTF